MTTAALPKAQILALYRALLKQGRQFQDYNFREYALRRTRDAFRESKGIVDPAKQQALVNEARANLSILQRQTLLNSMYSHPKLVVEKSP